MTHPIWVLAEKTNLDRPNAFPIENRRCRTSMWVFDSFEKAKAEFRNLIRHHATTNSHLFDGKGFIHEWDEYLTEQLEDDGDEFKSIPFLYKSYCELKRGAAFLRDVLPRFFTGEHDLTEAELEELYWTNHMAEISVQRGNNDIVCSICDAECDSLPSIYMNCLVMNDPELSYCCRLQLPDDYESDEREQVMIDLVCCELNETAEEEFRKES